MLDPRILIIDERKLVGVSIRTSLSDDKTFELWRRFKPAINAFPGRSSTDYYSVQFFDEDTTFENMTPATLFEKWAAVEVADFAGIPDELETLVIPAGVYAVFIHYGLPSRFGETATAIFRDWLPISEYAVDSRPHFEIMPADYRPDDPNASEEVWVPVRRRDQ